jgi:hypothetical protein
MVLQAYFYPYILSLLSLSSETLSGSNDGLSLASFSKASWISWILFNKMLSNKEEYADCMSAKGENFSTEVLFMILIFEQQKMINELITRLAEEKNVA